jgi:hypothetical protein
MCLLSPNKISDPVTKFRRSGVQIRSNSLAAQISTSGSLRKMNSVCRIKLISEERRQEIAPLHEINPWAYCLSSEMRRNRIKAHTPGQFNENYEPCAHGINDMRACQKIPIP